MGLDSIIVLVVVIAVILTTVILVMAEFKDVRNDIVYEETLSRTNETVLNTNISKTQTALQNRMAAESNNVWSAFGKANSQIGILTTNNTDLGMKLSTLSEDYARTASNLSAADSNMLASTNASFSNINSTLNSFYAYNSNQNAIYLNATELRVGSNATYGRMTFDPMTGLTPLNSNVGSNYYDLSANRVSIDASLDLNGPLHFANNHASYMLGVDGTSMYLKMPNATNNFAILSGTNGPNSTTPLNVTNNNVQFGTDVSLNGSLSFSNNYIIAVDNNAGDLFVRPAPTTNNGFTVRDSFNTPLLSVRNDKVTTQGQLCLANTCITPTEFAKLKTLAA